MSDGSITVRYFAHLSELADRDEEAIHINSFPDLETLFASLASRYDFPYSFEHIQVAVNHELGSHKTIVEDGDVVVFLPPMTGG